MKFNNSKIKKIITSNLIFLIVYELLEEAMEELIEEAIAFGITALISKTITAVFAVAITQTTKVLIKRLIKSITRKEGLDKMKFIKKIATFIWGNKLTTSMIFVSALAGYGAYLVIPLDFAFKIVIGAVVFILATIIAVKIGGENLSQIIDRFANLALNKEQKIAFNKAKAIAKKAEAEAKKLEELALKKLADEEKEKAEAEAKARQDALIAQKVAELKAKQSIAVVEKEVIQ